MRIIKINFKMLNELDQLKYPIDGFEIKQKLLWDLYQQDNPSPDIQTKPKGHLAGLNKLSHSCLENIYNDLVKILNTSTKFKESYPTYHEKIAVKILRRLTRLKFYQSFWIRNHNVDIYIPRYRLVIELNGGVHNDEEKMRKDNHRDKMLQHCYKIQVAHFDNNNTSLLAQTILNLLDSAKRFPSKAIKSSYRDLYIDTLATHCSFADLEKCLGSRTIDAVSHYVRKSRKGLDNALD